ncbi:hypothetical protein [Streptomyces sp. HPF1205]|uniref:hypothetical protein n=1 Tax=Streptomyces sp. HPF1205 TaxID=2873262 RepID=UPI001CECDFB7|nr:hypothetical protein [Streptomyces sp. HPF1205]
MLRTTFACLAAAAAAALVAPGQASAATAPPTPAPAACASVGGVAVGPLTLTPPEVRPGQFSTASLPLTDCGDTPQTVGVMSYGIWLSAASTGIPAGCPAIDPLVRQVVLAPHQTVSTATTYLVPASCTADVLRVTMQISGQDGTLLARRTADLVIDQPTAVG